MDSPEDIALADKMNAGRKQIEAELAKLIVGQEDVVHQVLLTLFVGGNSLIVGVPGLAKTLLIRTLAQVLDLQVQPHPVHARPDAVGHHGHGHHSGRRGDRHAGRWCSRPGPIFANIVLADEINRTPPKTQAALLEAMQEHRVTIQGRTYTLEEPFYVFATQNPIELEGTYPLPEAQLDRFMFHIVIEHPPEDEEYNVVRTTTAILDPKFERPVTGADLVAFQTLVRRVPVAEPVMRYALQLVRTSRPKAPNAPEMIKKYVAFGASVRAAQYLILGAKAKALTEGRYHVELRRHQGAGASGAAPPRADQLPRGVGRRHERRAHRRVAQDRADAEVGM